MKRTLVAGAVTALALITSAGAAEAATYCVAKPECVAAGGIDKGTDFKAAVSAAAGTVDPDRVELGAGTFTGWIYYNGASRLDVVGAGRGSTTIVKDPAQAVSSPILGLHGNATVRDLTVAITGTHREGLELHAGALAEHVDITGAEPAGNRAGLLIGGGVFTDGNITLGADDRGVLGDAGASLVERAEIRAATGVQVGSKTGTIAVRRTRIAATAVGAEAQAGRLDLDSVLVDMRQGGTGLNVVNWNSYDGALGIVGRHVTVAGDGTAASTGFRVIANTSTEMASGKLEHSIVTGFGHPVVRQASAGSAILTLHYSSAGVPLAGDDANTGTGTGVWGLAHSLAPAPEFVDPAHADFRLAPGSALIDAGRASALEAGESPLDLGGLARIADGNGDGTAQRDPGAFEQPVPVPPAETPAVTTAEAPAPASPTPASLTPAQDTLAPAIGRVSVKGGRVRFTLSEAAQVQVRLQRKRGTRWVSLLTRKRVAGKAGDNRVRLVSLRPGRYRVVLEASDAAGNTAKARKAFRR